MDTQCLTSADVSVVLQHLIDDSVPLEESLHQALEDARCWDLQLVCHNLFVARHIHANERGFDKIDRLYAADEEMALQTQELGLDLIEYLLLHERNPEEDLDEAMIAIQENMSRHSYARALRY